jgi:hypothetical protein
MSEHSGRERAILSAFSAIGCGAVYACGPWMELRWWERNAAGFWAVAFAVLTAAWGVTRACTGRWPLDPPPERR